MIRNQHDAKAATPSRRLLASLSLAMLIPSLGTSIANVGLPTLARAFAASFPQVQWVVLSYLLAITTLVVGAGRLGDAVGRRRLFLAGIALFTAASLLCGLTPNLPLLTAARAAQGLGAAVMMALAVAMARESVPQSKTGAAMGLLGTMSAIGTTLGPSLGGALIAAAGWRSLFLINVPLGTLNLLLARRSLPPDQKRPKSRTDSFDYPGTLLMAMTLATYALAMTTGRNHFGPLNAALLAASLLGLSLFLRAQSHATSPILPPATFRDPALAASLANSTIVSTVMMATLVVGPFYLSRTLHLDPASVGLAMSAGPLVAALTGVPAGRLVDRLGAPPVTLAGLAAITAGGLALSIPTTTPTIPGYLLPITLLTTGYALFQAANNTSIMSDTHPDHRGVVAGLLNLSRNLGLISGASAMGALFSLASAATDVATAPPDAVARGMRVTFFVAAIATLLSLALAIKFSRPAAPPA